MVVFCEHLKSCKEHGRLPQVKQIVNTYVLKTFLKYSKFDNMIMDVKPGNNG